MTHVNKMVAVVKVNGEVLREMGSSVYLPFNSEYSILIKNLNSKRAQVKITIDNEDILDGDALIVDANSDFELKRWLVGTDKTGPALKFIEKTNEIREQRGENSGMDGVIRISFRYEASRTLTRSPIWHDYGWQDHKVYNPNIWYSSETTTFGNVKNSVDGAIQTNFVAQSANPGKTTLRSLDTSQLLNEDGMTVKGKEVDQEFATGHLGILESEVHVITLNLKGGVFKDNKPVTVKTRIECSKCHKFNSWNSNFCSLCGNNLKY